MQSLLRHTQVMGRTRRSRIPTNGVRLQRRPQRRCTENGVGSFNSATDTELAVECSGGPLDVSVDCFFYADPLNDPSIPLQCRCLYHTICTCLVYSLYLGYKLVDSALECIFQCCPDPHIHLRLSECADAWPDLVTLHL